MLLAIDIGNSRTKFAIFHDPTGEVLDHHSFETNRQANVGDLASCLSAIEPHQIDAVIVCSVVPSLDAILAQVIERKYKLRPDFVSHKSIPGLTVVHTPKDQIGSDRLVNAFAGMSLYGTPTVVCSLGTATTIDVVLGGGRMAGGIIAPGLPVMSKALHLAAAKLPLIDPFPTETTLQTTTDGAIRSGLFNGYVGMVRHLINAAKSEASRDAKVVATGGLASLAKQFVREIDVADPLLTLNGLYSIHSQSD